MSNSYRLQKAPQLPKEILRQIQEPLNGKQSHNNHPKSVIGRKQRRKAERATKKLGKQQKISTSERSQEIKESESDISPQQPLAVSKQKSHRPQWRDGSALTSNQTDTSKKSRERKKTNQNSLRDGFDSVAASLPEDREIKAIERKLGIKGKKSSKAIADDGLEDLLTGLGDGSEDEVSVDSTESDMQISLKRKKSPIRDECKPKRRKTSKDEGTISKRSSTESLLSFPDSDSSAKRRGSMNLSAQDSDVDEFGNESESDIDTRRKPTNQASRVRENPYVAPPTAGGVETIATVKYVPPSLRGPSQSDINLKRQLQGLLNRLTESNLASIFREIEKKYWNNARQSVTSTLIELVFDTVASSVALSETFLMLQASFCTALYRAVGVDFGVDLIEDLVLRLDRSLKRTSVLEQTKDILNLITFLAYLFSFNMIGSNLIFDYVRIFLQTITESNTELLLRVLRTCGKQLRQDDPLALKDIVSLLHSQIARMGKAEMSVRTNFMVETITALKNNRMRMNQGQAIISEQLTRMRKVLGSLASGAMKAREPLRVTVDDVRNKSKRGRWWLVGASWKEGAEKGEANVEEDTTTVNSIDNTSVADCTDPEKKDGKDPDAELDLVALARGQLMITDVRRSIFVAIMSASDYRDAYIRLTKLKLKRSQEAEVAKVLLHCIAAESAYNPYYTLLARRLCAEYRFRMAFQYGLWQFLKELEKEDGRDDDSNGSDDNGEDLSRHGRKTKKKDWVQEAKIANYAHLYGSLIAQDALSILVLKVIQFSYLSPRTELFLEVLLSTIILDSQKGDKDKSDRKRSKERSNDVESLLKVFEKVQENPELKQGLSRFMGEVLVESDIVKTKEKARIVRWACKKIDDEVA